MKSASIHLLHPARSRLRFLWTKSPLRSGFEPLTQGFSVLCSNQLSYLNHFPKVYFLHRIAGLVWPQWRSLLKNREPARVKKFHLVRSGLLRYRRHQEQERGSPLLVTKSSTPPGDSTKRFFLSRNFVSPARSTSVPEEMGFEPMIQSSCMSI